MKKFSAAGTLVAASAAVATFGFGAPAFANASSLAHGVRPALTGHVLRAAGALERAGSSSVTPNNMCDGDNGSDFMYSRCGVNKCDGNDSYDVGCGSSSVVMCICGPSSVTQKPKPAPKAKPKPAPKPKVTPKPNRCDGDNDSDDVGCG